MAAIKPERKLAKELVSDIPASRLKGLISRIDVSAATGDICGAGCGTGGGRICGAGCKTTGPGTDVFDPEGKSGLTQADLQKARADIAGLRKSVLAEIRAASVDFRRAFNLR